MNEGLRYAKWNKIDTKEGIFYDSIYMTFYKRQVSLE